MRHGSLFSGIGGFDYAAQQMGWENIFHCEWNEFGQKVLKYYWPKAISYNDITKTDFTIHRGRIDVLTGGFPCQPYSQAGKRLGKEDERHLWPGMLRAIREIQPTWVVGENVFGLINWNGGLVFDEVQADLEAEGYEVQAYVLPACAVNAPHRRDRVWFVAYASSFGTGDLRNSSREEGTRGSNELPRERGGLHGDAGLTPDADGNGHEHWRLGEDRREEREGEIQGNKRERVRSFDRGVGEQGVTPYTCGPRLQQLDTSPLTDRERHVTGGIVENWRNFPTVAPVCNGDDGLSARLDAITFPRWTRESIKAGGNAIVPQVAIQIFKSIDQWKRTYSN